MEIQDKKFVIAYQDNKNIKLKVVYGTDELDAMLYFLSNSTLTSWLSPEDQEDWVKNNCGTLINYIEV